MLFLLADYLNLQLWVPRIEVPRNHPTLDHFSTETYGFRDPPILRNTPFRWFKQVYCDSQFY